MKLQLFVNGYAFKEMILPREIFAENNRIDAKQNTDLRKEIICDYAHFMEGKFWSQIGLSKSWAIYLTVGSKMNERDFKQDIRLVKH